MFFCHLGGSFEMRASRRAAVKTVDILNYCTRKPTIPIIREIDFFFIAEVYCKTGMYCQLLCSTLLNIGALCFAGIPSITALSLFPHTDFTFLWTLLVLQFFNHSHIMCVNIELK